MPRYFLIIFLWVSWQSLSAQNLNDNCENATDITSEVFHFDQPAYCNVFTGAIHIGYGLVSDEIDQPTVDPAGYSSQECEGYTSQTTDHYPDIWYKTTFQPEEGSLNTQLLYLNIWDTVQLAVYYGQCGALYQSQCVTLTYTDSTLWEGFWIDYLPHNPEDDIYFQLKVPPHYQGYAELCFSTGLYGFLYYTFNYDRPATTGNVTQTNLVKPAVPIKLYPNPAKTSISVVSASQILSYTISDLQGKNWMSGEGTENHISLTIQHLPAGVYVIKVETEEGMVVSRYFKH